MATRAPAPAPEWLPSGFPPRSFQPGGAAPPPPPPAPGGGRRGGRGWWLAAAAGFLAVLLLAGALLAMTGGEDDEPEVAASSSTTTTTVVDTSLPTFEATTTALPVLPSIEPVTTPSSDSTPTTSGGAAGPGVLEPAVSTLTLPRADASAGASQAPLTLRNRGATALTYTVQSNAPGLSAAPAQGRIEPNASTVLTVTLDAAQVRTEGPFGATLSFGGTGGTAAVQVMSIAGRPPEIREGVGESCPAPSAACSRQIKLGPATSPSPTPCNTAWLYAVTITDQSRLQSARAMARKSGVNADVPLQRYGTTDIFLSDPSPQLDPGTTLRFVIEAVDEHGFGRRLAEQTIAC